MERVESSKSMVETLERARRPTSIERSTLKVQHDRTQRLPEAPAKATTLIGVSKCPWCARDSSRKALREGANCLLKAQHALALVLSEGDVDHGHTTLLIKLQQGLRKGCGGRQSVCSRLSQRKRGQVESPTQPLSFFRKLRCTARHVNQSNLSPMRSTNGGA